MLVTRSLLILLTLLISVNSFSQSVDRIQITPDSHKVEYLSQNEREYSIDYVTNLDENQWTAVKRTLPFGLISRNYWIKLTIDVPQSIDKQWFLEVSNPLIDELKVYVKTTDGFSEYRAGDTVPKQPNMTPTRVYLYPLTDAKPTSTLYLKYTGSAASTLPLALVSENEALANAAADAFIHGMLFLLFIASAFCAVFAYFMTGNKALLYLAGYATTTFIITSIIEGYARLVIWPTQPWLQNLITPSLMVFGLWLLSLFLREAFDLKTKLAPRFNLAFSVLLKIQVALSAILLALPVSISVLSAIAIIALTLCTFVLCGYHLHRRGEKLCPLFLLSGVAVFLTIACKALFLSGYWPHPALNSATKFFYFMHFSLMIAALIKQYYSRYQSTAEKQQQILTEAQKNVSLKQATLAEQQEEQLTLEALVDERTFELNMTLRELQETNRRLEEQATNDALTGAKNRKFFDQRLLAEYRLSRRQQTPVSLLMLDIDHFKKVNDTYGHLAGDKVLISFANSTINLLRRPNDYVCRYGGEEFAVLLSNTDHKGALKVAEIIRQRTEESSVLCDGLQLNVTVSIGVATLTIDDTVPADELFSQADKALYQAKAQGRNQVFGASKVQA